MLSKFIYQKRIRCLGSYIVRPLSYLDIVESLLIVQIEVERAVIRRGRSRNLLEPLLWAPT